MKNLMITFIDVKTFFNIKFKIHSRNRREILQPDKEHLKKKNPTADIILNSEKLIPYHLKSNKAGMSHYHL